MHLGAAIAVAVVSAGACTTDPVYLGVTSEDERTPEDPPAPEGYDCDPSSDFCFIDAGIDEADVEATFDREEEEIPSELEPPVWHYPLAESMHPSNLGLLTLHFEHTEDEEAIFELIVGSDSRRRTFYFPCLSAGGSGCLFQVPELMWNQTATAYRGETVQLRLRAGNPNGLSEAAELTLRFSPEPVNGGLYYWSAELEGIYRLVFGGREAVPYVQNAEEDPDNPDPSDDCSGCHALSRDGTTIAFSQGSSEDGEQGILENAAFKGSLKVASVTALESPSIAPDPDAPSDSGMMSVSRFGELVASAFDFGLELRDTQSGNVLDQVGEADLAGLTPYFPEFHPEDTHLVLTLTEEADRDSEIGVRRGAIATIAIDEGTFGEVTIVVPSSATEAHYYPTWSPDGRFIAFVSGPAGTRSYDQPNSHLRMVSVETGEIFNLDRATGPSGSTSTWPKFAPFEQCPERGSCDPNERLFFLTFSSKRPYGLVANNPGDPLRSQLWMSAIDVSLATNGADPSSVPFWVPYQEPDSRNHLGYWTEALKCNEIYGCGSSHRCDDETGECIAIPR